MINYIKNDNHEQANLQMWRQLRAVYRKYGTTHELKRLNIRVSVLAAILGYPKWKIVYYPSGVYELTLKVQGGRYDYFAIYVRHHEYEVRFHDSFMRDSHPLEIRRYLERKDGDF